jgi:hypothetical protein
MARISFQDFHFTKAETKASPQLMLSEDGAAPMLVFHPEDLLVTSYTTAGAGGGDVLIDVMESPEQNVFARGPGDYLLV